MKGAVLLLGCWAGMAAAPSLAQETSEREAPVPKALAALPKRAVCAVTPKDYPVASLRAGEQGRTRLAYTVLATGELGAVWVVQSSGFPRLDHAAIRVLRTCPLPQPKAPDGSFVEASYTVELHWALE